MVGYIADNAWGLTFGQSAENGHSTGGIQYILPIGPLYLGGIIYKETDNSFSAVVPATATDVDWDRYILFARLHFKGGEAGLMGTFDRMECATTVWEPALGFAIPTGAAFAGATGALKEVYTLQPFVKVKIGPVKLEGEFIYSWGSVDSMLAAALLVI